MEFEDEVIKHVNIADADSVSKMIIEYLCGEKYYKEPLEDDKNLLFTLLEKAEKMMNGLSYEQFNEILLLLDQDRVSEDFFEFFFGKKEITLEELKRGIIKFRGYAMLRFGNYRFAYKKLIQRNKEEIEKELDSYMKKDFKKRPKKMLEIVEIERNKTWYAGYISKRKFEKEHDYIKRLISSQENDGKKNELIEELKKRYDKKANIVYMEHMGLAKKCENEYSKIEGLIKDVEKKALKNTDIYLTWDYMDIYIATSMRHKWEFEETFDFIKDVFEKEEFAANRNPLKNLNLRYFDPTQSLCRNRIDKGLIEGLMLKRAFCTVYMAQESDTMGKDSELAATLAQGKLVIAYVPKKDDIAEYSKEIKEYPLDFFEKRLLILQAEEVFSDIVLIQKLDQVFSDTVLIQKPDQKYSKWRVAIDFFIEQLNSHRINQPFTLMGDEEKEFKGKLGTNFDNLCTILAIAESYNFDKRAKTLQEIHPLAIQVDLKLGVANGVLVVRNAVDCSKLIHRILTNSMKFVIKHVKLFNLSKSEHSALSALMNKNKGGYLAGKFFYDSCKRTLNLKKALTNEEINYLERLSKDSSCPEGLKKDLERIRLDGVTMLEEEISGSPYRVVTNDEKLTNSFWNFY